jgi:hypothetical protein
LKKNIIPFTIHDSIIVENKHNEKAMKIIESVFKENFGKIPSFEFK